jgi:type IV secretory pathway TrbL component
MSALLSAAASASFTFHGASVSLSCSSPDELRKALATFGIGTHAANDSAPTTAKAKPAATPAAQPEGNASASTGTPAGAQPAAAGSAASGEGEKRPDYSDVTKRVLALAKIKKQLALETLGKFTGQNGQPADHGTKLKLEDYPAFLAAADQVLKANGVAV